MCRGMLAHRLSGQNLSDQQIPTQHGGNSMSCQSGRLTGSTGCDLHRNPGGTDHRGGATALCHGGRRSGPVCQRVCGNRRCRSGPSKALVGSRGYDGHVGAQLLWHGKLSGRGRPVARRPWRPSPGSRCRAGQPKRQCRDQPVDAGARRARCAIGGLGQSGERWRAPDFAIAAAR